MAGRILVGHVLDRLCELPDESVHCVVCSPPYYGLRDYGIEPQVWGGDAGCEHEWGDDRIVSVGNAPSNKSTLTTNGGKGPLPGDKYQADQVGKASNGAFCLRCSAWRGSLGLEPTLALYLDHMTAVFREVRRVMRKDATCWLNIGDSYCAAQGGRQAAIGELPKDGKTRFATSKAKQREDVDVTGWAHGAHGKRVTLPANSGLKPKDLMMVPARLAIRLQEDGAASPDTMRVARRLIAAITASYDTRDEWPERIASEVERLEREWADAQAGGWWVRSDIAWCKRAPMPESATDRPTSAWEHVFLLTKSAKYFYDAEAVKELADGDTHSKGNKLDPPMEHAGVGHIGWTKATKDMPSTHRNQRNVWLLGPEPFPEAHFATFPTEIPRRAILAGTSERGVCPKCAAPWERVVVSTGQTNDRDRSGSVDWIEGVTQGGNESGIRSLSGATYKPQRRPSGEWRPTCGCGIAETIPGTILDCFGGSGTSGLVADRLGRDAILVELNPEYAAMARRRIEADAPLFAEVAD